MISSNHTAVLAAVHYAATRVVAPGPAPSGNVAAWTQAAKAWTLGGLVLGLAIVLVGLGLLKALFGRKSTP